MNIFAKTVFFYTHADEKWRKTVLKDQTDHQKLEKSYFDSLSAGERKRIIRMLPHLARKSR
jgi:ABC-type molybdenum transport system ATPase subunit/photorepair protein PhrA